MLAIVNAWVKGRPIPPMEWSGHGPVPVLFDLPFIKLGKMFVSPDFMLSFQPVLLTAGIVTVLYLWLRKLCSPKVSLLLTFTGAFGTMLWPYAYISLETKLSFFYFSQGTWGLPLEAYVGVDAAAAVRYLLRPGRHAEVRSRRFVPRDCIPRLHTIP